MREYKSHLNYFGTHAMKLRFNLSRAPWWGGLFERLIGIMKKSLSKTIGKGMLSFNELEEVLLYVHAMEERQQARKKSSNLKLPGVGSIVLIKDEVKERHFSILDELKTKLKERTELHVVLKFDWETVMWLND